MFEQEGDIMKVVFQLMKNLNAVIMVVFHYQREIHFRKIQK